MRESAVASHVRLDAAYNNELLWRNNVGVLLDMNDRPVRYGLANDSAKQNAEVKSGDYIGIKPTLIEPWHVGYVIGRFVSIETKPEGWTPPNPTNVEAYKHYLAQRRWADIVSGAGGLAGFAASLEDYKRIVGR